MVFGWHSRRIYSLCLKTVIVARSMVMIWNLLYQLIYTNCINWIFLYQFVFATPGEWLYKLFMHQACVLENQYQYDMSNKILSNVISVAFMKGHITLSLKEAIEAFQIKLNNKRQYLAFYIRKSIHNCYDAVTTSPCESMNRHIKHTSKATTLNNIRWVKQFLYEVIRMISFVLFGIFFFRTYNFVVVISYILFRLCYSVYQFIYILPLLAAWNN